VLTCRRGRRGARALLATACCALGVGHARDARADSCTDPDLIETIPADNATGIPLNASLFARYEANAQYDGEAVTMEMTDDAPPDAGALVDAGTAPDGGALTGTPVAVAVSFDSAEGLLQVTPQSSLTPGASFVVHFPALRGVDTATLGSKADLHFIAGTASDTAAPTFGGITSVSWDVSRDTDSCTNQVEERYVFNLAVGDAADDGGRSALTMVVFETSGPGVDAGTPVPVSVQRIPPAGQDVTVTSTDLVGHVCFAAIVQDLTGKASTSGAPVCVDTVAPPFFYSCGVAGGRRPDSGGLLTAGAALALLLRRKRDDPRRSLASRREGRG
jgi:hypothetical protein